MKIKLFIFSIGLVFLMSVPIFSQTLISGSFINGKNNYEIKVDRKDLENTPSWNPETEEVPLSYNKAIEIGRMNLKRFISTEDDKWDIRGINLTFPGGYRWIYEITYYCFQEGCKGTGPFYIYVKLDGTIVEPKITPVDKKDK